jgi:hypothetical protein
MQVLIRDKAEQLVLDDGAAECTAEDVAMQLWIRFALRYNNRVILEEEWVSIDPVGAAMTVDSSVVVVGAGGGGEIDVRRTWTR